MRRRKLAPATIVATLVCAAVALAIPVLAAVPQRIASPPTDAQRKALSHLFASGMASAWNARAAAKESQAPTVVVADRFGNGKPRALFRNNGYIDAGIVGGAIDNPGDGSGVDHGYHVTGIIFGDFANDGTSPGLVTGAFPRRGKLVTIDRHEDASLVHPVELAAAIDAVQGRVVVNTSLGYTDCVASTAGKEAVDWIEIVRPLGFEDRVFHATAAGNEGAVGGSALCGSEWSAAATRTDLTDDQNVHVDPLTNTMAVENVLEKDSASGLTCLTTNSNTDGSIAAPGQNVHSFNKSGGAEDSNGTSMSSPFIAGLATYLWSIAPDLTPQQLVSAIRQNPQPPPDDPCERPSAPLVDAYAATLSLDQTGTPSAAGWPVRFAILNKDGNQVFDHKDVEAIAPKVKRSLEPTVRDWSRFDLNGDGYTGGFDTAPFDLDRSNSTRAGQTGLAGATATIEGSPASFNEDEVADADVLCFYAYSPLYAGSPTRRTAALKKLCPTSKIAFESRRDGNAEIYVMNADGSAQTRLTDDPATDAVPALSPDGSKIAFMSVRDGNQEIYVMNADGSAETRLTDNEEQDTDPTFSPDGSKIVFWSSRDGNAEIYVMDATPGATATRLTNDAASDFRPTFSPDGSKIAWESYRDGNNAELYLMNADGSAQTRLTNNPLDDAQADFSPDGSKLVFWRRLATTSEIYVMDATPGAAATRLTKNQSDTAPVFSPDGSRLAFARLRGTEVDIHTMKAAPGSKAKRLTTIGDNREPDW